MNIVVIIGIIIIVWYIIGHLMSIKENKRQEEQDNLLRATKKPVIHHGYINMNEKTKDIKYKKSQKSTPKHKNDPTKSIPGSGPQETKKEKPFRGVKPKGNKKKDPKKQNKVKEKPTSAVKPKPTSAVKPKKNKKKYYYKKKKSNKK